MIKYYCDKYGKEIEYLKRFKINTEQPFSSSRYGHSFIVCEECFKSIENFIKETI